MSADDNGVGGTFAFYSLLCHHAKLSMLPNQQDTDEKLSVYGVEKAAETWQSFAFKSFFEKHTVFRKGLLIFVLLGTCMTIGNGVFTPAISDYVVAISCVLLVGIFSIQHHGTNRVAFLFAPIVTAWLLSIAGIGIYNIIKWNPRIFQALSPIYMVKSLKETRREGWLSLGGVVLSITGVESKHAAFLSRHRAITRISKEAFIKQYQARKAVFWPVFIVATSAAVVGSQAAISATFSIISQCCCALNCFPHVKIVRTSRKIYGQVYILEESSNEIV
ncbi:potassium transporter 1 [Artemisia annua]|uniref:Potassium transporter 1 n=1 Tax=Artemisia annua TaxID=35608 RepID=A0A2U1P4G0_ARTAN|nr:potassium transporter 1 [Artemisia annua]